MKVFGLTGGVASGKSTVAERLAKQGFTLIDTDGIAHDLLAKNQEVIAKVKDTFHTTDRSALRKIVFGNDEKRKQLEAILHPKIAEVVQDELNRLRKLKTQPRAVAVMVPLLFEAGWDRRFDQNIAVLATEALQLERLKKRDGITESLAREMIHAQLPNATKKRRAHFVIENNGTMESLNENVDQLAANLLD